MRSPSWDMDKGACPKRLDKPSTLGTYVPTPRGDPSARCPICGGTMRDATQAEFDYICWTWDDYGDGQSTAVGAWICTMCHAFTVSEIS
jgi:hypothetical protein